MKMVDQNQSGDFFIVPEKRKSEKLLWDEEEFKTGKDDEDLNEHK